MRHPRAVSAILRHYPRIFLACHRRHTRDPKTGALVSERQVQILDHLDEIEPLSLSALAGHMGVTLSTMSIAVERLVNRGFVTRVADTADRRRVRLRLTESGARVCESQSVLDAELVDAMVAALARRDRTPALKGLALLARAAGESQRARSQRAIRSA